MKKLLILIVVLAFATSASASIWNHGGGDDLWTTAGHWSAPAGVPTSTDSINFYRVNDGWDQLVEIPAGSVGIVGTGGMWLKAASEQYHVTVKGTMDVYGGRINLGYAGGTGSLIADGGLINQVGANDSIYVGYTSHSTYGYGNATLEVKNGGYVDFYEIYLPKTTDGSTGHVELGEGTIDLGRIFWNSNGSMNITEGTLLLDGNKVSDIDDYVTDGWLTAYGGSGTVIRTYDSGTNHTIVTGIPEPITIALLGLGGLALVRRKR
jgi:hypothetical protein